MAAENEGKSGQQTLILIMLMVNMLAIIGIGVFLVIGGGNRQSNPDPTQHGQGENGGGGQDSQENDGSDPETDGPVMVPMESFTVNLHERGSRSFLRITVQLEADNPLVAMEIGQRKVAIRDQVIVFLSSLKVSETQGVVNKARIRENILSMINSQLHSGKVKALYFTDFIIQ